MKTSLFFAALLCLFSVNAQVEIREMSNGQSVGNDISGTTWVEEVDADGVYTLPFDVLNTTGITKSLKVNRYRVIEEPLWSDYITWSPNPDPNFEGTCYPTSAMNADDWTSNSVSVSGNGHATLQVNIITQDPGSALYRYRILEGNVALDSIDVQVNYFAGINEVEESGMTVYPNPANNSLTIVTTGTDGSCNIRITDVLGKVVYTDKIETTDKLDVSEFKNGVYFVTVAEKGQSIQTRRIVVKH